MTAKVLLTVPEAAEALACGRTLVFRLIASGDLAALKLGRLTRIPATAIDELVARRLGEFADAAGLAEQPGPEHHSPIMRSTSAHSRGGL